jgi:hypothetical protein
MVAAATELVTGLAVLAAPSLVTQLLFGGELSRIGLAMAPVAGFALIALALACWPSRIEAWSPTTALRSLLLYNVMTAGYLGYLGVGGADRGVLLWPAVALHALLALLLGWALLSAQRSGS